MRSNVYVILWHRNATKAFEQIKDHKLRMHILNALENHIAYDPFIGKPLMGLLKGFRAYRIGVLRILYKIYKDRLVVIILDIAHRKDIYKSL